MATFQLDQTLPQISPSQSLAGWHREFCVELLGNSEARIFVRAVDKGSSKATELQRATLFERLDTRFVDLAECTEAIRDDLDQLIDSARRTLPSKDNLFTTLEYDRPAWGRVQTSIDRWARRRADGPVWGSEQPPHVRRRRGAGPVPRQDREPAAENHHPSFDAERD